MHMAMPELSTRDSASCSADIGKALSLPSLLSSLLFYFLPFSSLISSPTHYIFSYSLSAPFFLSQTHFAECYLNIIWVCSEVSPQTLFWIESRVGKSCVMIQNEKSWGKPQRHATFHFWKPSWDCGCLKQALPSQTWASSAFLSFLSIL